MNIGQRAVRAVSSGWNAFRNQEEERESAVEQSYAPKTYSSRSNGGLRPDRHVLSFNTDKSIIASIYTRISIDVAAIPIKHVRLDENDRFTSVMKTGLNYCLNVEANPDQGGRQFRQDLTLSLCDEGVIAVCPIDTTTDPEVPGYQIQTMRVGKIVEWSADEVVVNLWRQDTQLREDVRFKKNEVAIVENPLYPIMNSRNSTLQRLVHKLNILDAIDEQSASGKLDIIIQLPYVVKSESKRDQAEQRRKALEEQMKDAKYGIGYIDINERITQLNRPSENNMLAQIEYLTKMVYSQLGLTPEVFDGTADEQQMLNYHNRTIDPILGAIVEALIRSFITKTAQSQGQSIQYFRDPFKYIPMSKFPELADKLTRNEVATGNEMRGVIGWAPSKDPRAEELRNKNIPQPVDETADGEKVDSEDEPQVLTQVRERYVKRPEPMAIEK